MLALVLVVGAGCATSEYMGRVLKPQDETYIRATHPHAELRVTVPLDGRPEQGHIIAVQTKETYVALADREILVPNETVKEIRVHHHRGPALIVGLSLGALVGAVFGALTLRSACSRSEEGCPFIGADNALVPAVGGVAYGLLGGAAGAGVGALIGQTTSYWYGSFAP